MCLLDFRRRAFEEGDPERPHKVGTGEEPSDFAIRNAVSVE